MLRFLILTGNDHDEDSDKEPEPPTKTVDKALPRSSKRNAPDVAPGAQSERNAGAERGGRGGRRGGFTGNEDGGSTIHSHAIKILSCRVTRHELRADLGFHRSFPRSYGWQCQQSW